MNSNRICLIAVLMALSATAGATILTFEDLQNVGPGHGEYGGEYGLINTDNAGYGGFQWGEWAGWVYKPLSGWGFPNIIVGDLAFFNHSARDVSMSLPSGFHLESMVLGAGRWPAGVNVTFEGQRGGATVAQQTATALYYAPTTVVFSGFQDIDTLWISSGGEDSHEFCIDNITFERGGSAVPEPASCALLALAIGGIGVTLKRRRSK